MIGTTTLRSGKSVQCCFSTNRMRRGSSIATPQGTISAGESGEEGSSGRCVPAVGRAAAWGDALLLGLGLLSMQIFLGNRHPHQNG
jgi:hypothetical protein